MAAQPQHHMRANPNSTAPVPANNAGGTAPARALPLRFAVWGHKANDTDWSEGSYVRLGEVATIEDFWGAVMVMQDFLDEMMFFMMVEGAVPRWEHESNRDGGYFSVRVDTKGIKATLENMACKLVSGTLLRGASMAPTGGADAADRPSSQVVGLSTSSKGKFGIIKAWMRTCEVTNGSALAIDGAAKNTVRFTPHVGKSCGGAGGEVVGR